jgi:hypothetical protein
MHVMVIIQELHVDIVFHHTVSQRLAVHHSGHWLSLGSLSSASVSLPSV